MVGREKGIYLKGRRDTKKGGKERALSNESRNNEKPRKESGR